NLVLLCRLHHGMIHQGWELTCHPDGTTTATPPLDQRAEPGGGSGPPDLSGRTPSEGSGGSGLTDSGAGLLDDSGPPGDPGSPPEPRPPDGSGPPKTAVTPAAPQVPDAA
ncbi:MAG: hypothetical protein ACXV3F_16435, partial [Frankiaceae bacterium]